MQQTNWKWNIFRFLSAQTISLFGSSLVQFSIIWYITISSDSGRMLTLSTLCGFLPQIAVSVFAGAYIDRYNRKTMIMLADSVIALSTLALAIAFLLGERNNWLLFGVLVIRSLGTGIQTPLVNSIIPQIVPQQALMRINGINSTLASLMMLASPAVSGMIFAASSLEATLFIDVITAIIGVAITATLPIQPHERSGEQQSNLRDIKDGFAYLKQNRMIRQLLLFQITIMFLISPSAFLTPLLVGRTFGMQVWRLTASEMTFSLGMVCGGILITAWGGFSSRIKTTLIAGAVYGVLMLGIGLAPAFWVYLLCNACIGVTSPCYNAPVTVLLQERVPTAMQGRVFSLMQVSTSCALPLGMVMFGPLADHLPIQLLLIACGVLVLSAVLLASRGFGRELR